MLARLSKGCVDRHFILNSKTLKCSDYKKCIIQSAKKLSSSEMTFVVYVPNPAQIVSGPFVVMLALLRFQ